MTNEPATTGLPRRARATAVRERADAPSVNGWTLVGTLRHRPGQPTIVQAADDARIDVDAWSRSEGWCEQCRTRRSRRTTYLLRHADGRLTQVGSSCLAEFTGHANPLRVMGHANQSRIASAQRSNSPFAVPDPVEYIDTMTYLAHVSQAVIDTRFVPAGAGTSRLAATWTQAAAAFERGRPPSARAERRARETLHWLRYDLARRDLDDFERRLVTVLHQDRLTRRELPTAAAAIYAFHRHLRRQIAARKTAGEHIGAPGDTVHATFTVARVERAATCSGPVRRHFLRDDLGRRAIWDGAEQKLTTGQHRLEVSVASHGELRGQPITILARCQPVR